MHYRFVRIHPFDDGNGRIARLLMNLALMRHRLPVVIVKTDDKESYYRALQLADGGNLDGFVSYIATQELASQELWLRGAKGEPLDDLEKEIQLFKAQLRNPRKKEVRDRGTEIKHVVEKVILPTERYILSKLSSFQDLFEEHSEQNEVSIGHAASIWNGFDLPSTPVKFEEIRDVTATFEFRRSKDKILGVENAILMAGFVFEEDGDKIWTGVTSASIRKNMNEDLNSDEIDLIVKILQRQLLDYLKRRADHVGYELE